MAATVCPAPQFVGLDNSGNPLSGGKLYSYSAGTTTNLNTFSDSDLSVPNANPIILDAGGRATVYLSASSYKFKLTSSGDDVIYTQDNVISSAPYDVDLDVPFVAGEAVTAGQAIYLSDGTGSRTAGRWYLTDSDTAAYSTLPITGFAVAAVALAATGSVRLLGRASVPGTLSVGATYFLGATPGALASSAGTFSKAMGVADTASTLVMTVQQTISQVANLLVTGTLRVNGVATFDVQPILSSLTASRAVFTDGSKGLVSNAITGTGNVVMSASPTLTGTIGAAAMTLSTPLPVASGGTGIAAITANTVMLGAGTSDVTLLAPGTSGNLMTSNGTLWQSTAPSGGTSDLAIVEGRLTLTSGTPVTTADVTGATNIYFAPYTGNRIALYDGSSDWNIRTFTVITIAVGTIDAGKPYDLFAYDNSGTVTFDAPLAWTNDTARATALTTQNGVLVKSGATTRRYIGTFYTTATTTTEDSYAKRLLWNYYNRVTRPMAVVASGSWTYQTSTFRQANASTANQLEFVVGWAEVGLDVFVLVTTGNSDASVRCQVGVGFDSTTAPDALGVQTAPATALANERIELSAALRKYPAVGQHVAVWLEKSEATGTTSWMGSSGDGYVSGIIGSIAG